MPSNERLADRAVDGILDKEALKHYRPTRLERPDLAKSAVLIPLISDARGDRLILTVRHEALRFQPGSISFPGGKAEPAESDLLLCALRETEEEIALPRSAIEVVGELDQITVAARYLVTPFVGLVAPEAPIAPGVGEVSQVIVASVSDFLGPDALEATTDARDGAARISYRFKAGTAVIWGATARILKRFLEVGYGARYADSPEP
ncbi:MAG: NUDIX hydrolase [Steroidobacteraceae bacterium]